MFGRRAQAERCRTHKLRNVVERLPKADAAQTKPAMMEGAQEIGKPRAIVEKVGEVFTTLPDRPKIDRASFRFVHVPAC